MVYFITKSDTEVDHSIPDHSLFEDRIGNNHYLFLLVQTKYACVVMKQWSQKAVEASNCRKISNFMNASVKITRSFENMQ